MSAFTDTGVLFDDGSVLSSAGGVMTSNNPLSIPPGETPTEAVNLGQLQRSSMYVNANYTMVYSGIPSISILSDTSAGPYTIILPDAPPLGTIIEFIDGAGTWATNNLTLSSANTIMGDSSPLICNISGEVFRLWFNTSNDWRLE